jgi:C4-dicarboxylate-specific signal transduction histidine kinase
MNYGIKPRLAALGFAVAGIGTLLVLITLGSQRQVAELQSRLSGLGSESSGIMDQFEASLRKLNDAILAYGTDHDPLVWQNSLQVGSNLEIWIQAQQAVLKTPDEKKLLQQIQTAYTNYRQTAWNFHAKVESLNGKTPSLADFTPVRKQSHQLFVLGKTLARTHYQLHEQVLDHTNQSLKHLYSSVLELLALLFVFGIALALVVYRHLVVPLRQKLAQTRELAALHNKLASLGLLASDVAHEVRNPLTSIKIGLAHQKGKFQSGTPERAGVELVEREILRLESILDDLLALTRTPAPKPAQLDLRTFLRELSTDLDPRLTGLDVQLVAEVPAALPVRVDAAQIKQAIISLVQDAADELGIHAGLALRAHGSRELLSGIEKDVAVVEVAVTSQEFSPGESDQVAPVAGGGKKESPRSGVSIAEQIIKKHGGELQRDPQTKNGALYRIILPR